MPGGYPTGLWGVCNGTDIGTNTAASLGTALTATRGSYGSYVQLIASTAADCSWCELCFGTGIINNLGGAIKLAVGSAGNEVVILSDLVVSTIGNLGIVRVSFPICIPSGTRIAAAAQCFNGGGETAYYVNAQLYDGGFDGSEGIAGFDSIGFDTTNGIGTVITAAGSTNTKGSYTQLVASTAKDYAGLFIIPDVGATSTATGLLLDIAIGAGGSEQIIIPNWYQHPFLDKMASGFVPVRIPAGTRVAVRCQSATASQTIGISLQAAYQ
jgi:hypothetical protein